MSDFLSAAADALDRQAVADEAATRLRQIIAGLDANDPDDLAVLHHILGRLRAGICLLEAKGVSES